MSRPRANIPVKARLESSGCGCIRGHRGWWAEAYVLSRCEKKGACRPQMCLARRKERASVVQQRTESPGEESVYVSLLALLV